MNIAIGIFTIGFGIILFILLLTPAIMGMGGAPNPFLKVFIFIVSFGIPVFTIWMGWSIIQGNIYVPLWAGLIPPLSVLIGWIYLKAKGNRGPDRSKILQITPSYVSKIIHECAFVSPGISKNEHKHEIMEIIDHSIVIANSIQMNNPDYRFPVNKTWPYSLEGITEIAFVVLDMPLEYHGRNGSPSITKDEIFSIAKNSSGNINSNDSTSIEKAISFFKDDSNTINDSQKMNLRRNIGKFLWSVEKYLSKEDSREAKF